MSRTIKSKVVGVTFQNADGTDRQSLIRKHCHEGMPLGAVIERDNPHSANGTAVSIWATGSQIGYLRDGLAGDVAEHIERGGQVSVTVLSITGGTKGKSRGVNVSIELLPTGSLSGAFLSIVSLVLGLAILGAILVTVGYLISWIL